MYTVGAGSAKSALIDRWLQSVGHGVRSQAIEAAPPLQLAQVVEDLRHVLNTEQVPTTWEQLFELIERHPQPLNICLDEFPYLVTSDPSVPSRFQRWLDRSRKRDLCLVLAGSSVRTMHSAALSEDSPLYGRAQENLNIGAMRFQDLCEYFTESISSREAFLTYCLLGGVPKYWQLVQAEESAVETASRLFFASGAYMHREPFRLLSDEKVDGLSPISVLEAIGRGAKRPNEIAARMGVSQGSISKVLHALMEASIIKRQLRFGDQEKTSKTLLYEIVDPTVRFWFSVYSPTAAAGPAMIITNEQPYLQPTPARC